MIDSLYPFAKKWSEQGTIWIYSDPHFGDEDLKKGIASRPSDEEQIRRINSKVGKNDHLILLGDIGEPEWLGKLRGHKILILGNHDAGASNYEPYCDEVYGGPLMISDKIILSHEPLNAGWAMNLHGHNHSSGFIEPKGRNFCAEAINYTPVNFNQLMKTGLCSKIQSVHRIAINEANERSKSRKGSHKKS